MPTTNAAGLALIQSFEGLQLHTYRDMVGVPTIGWGHTGPNVHMGQTITREQADAFLRADLGIAESGVQARVPVQLTPNQFAALVSLVYNVGIGCLVHTHLIDSLRNKDFQGAADNILLFDHAGGHKVPGLTRRRQAERKLFLTP